MLPDLNSLNRRTCELFLRLSSVFMAESYIPNLYKSQQFQFPVVWFSKVLKWFLITWTRVSMQNVNFKVVISTILCYATLFAVYLIPEICIDCVLQVFLSTRRGVWVLHRIGTSGVPFDIHFTRRFVNILLKIIPLSYANRYMKGLMSDRLDHDLYGLRAEHEPLAQHPTVNDDLGNRIACGSLVVKDNIKRFTATGVEFVDGSFEDNIELVSCYRSSNLRSQ